MTANYLAIEHLDAGYSDVEVLDDVTVRVGEGEVVTLIGPNGAGKSTLMDTIYGLATVQGGSIGYRGADITRATSADLLRNGLAYVPQKPSVFPQMTVTENLMMGGFIWNDDTAVRERIDDLYEEFDHLAQYRDTNARALSGGEQQLLEIARALVTDPDLVMFDEPSLGLEPRYVDMVFDRISGLKAAGKTVLLVEQNAERGLTVGDRAYIIADGRVQHEGDASEMLKDEEIGRHYLGG